jgi:hypothetical protein
MSLRSIRARLARLERRKCAGEAGTLPPGFWDALCGATPLEQLHPEKRRLVEELNRPADSKADSIEARIAAALRQG